jgi:NAD(P)-dependent dehydrogenase (short-subunit alcohol dehydrogenase family)
MVVRRAAPHDPGMPTGIITGASRGLGLALTRALAAEGWDLVVDARDGEALEHATRGLEGVTAVAGDVADDWHRQGLVAVAGERIDLLVNNASILGPSPLPALERVSLRAVADVHRVNAVAPLALAQLVLPHMPAGGRVVSITSDAAVEAYPGWGAYGASKAALERLSAVLAAEHPELRVYTVDPGDMRTAMHQEAFPGEDISDRPPPEESVPGLLALVEGDLPSGRYRAADLAGVHA